MYKRQALHVHRGEILTLIGPNGSGKSTILKSLIRQLALIGGTVYLDGKSLQTLPERDLARTMSVLLTEHVRPELMTCWDVAEMCIRDRNYSFHYSILFFLLF